MMTKRIVSGVLLLNKPAGISSHTALNQAKRLFMSADFDSKKAGHTGTLDPMATGLLPICLGEATKFSGFGLDADKGYTAIIKLGAQTDTGDKEGQIIKTAAVAKFSQDNLDNIANTLIGEQMQVPPMYSALKKDGKKLYEYARDGIEVERAARPIVIHQLSLQKISDDEISLNVVCSKGTYVRTLGESVAEKLGTVGHLTSLHRTQTGGFDAADTIGLDELSELSFDERFTKLMPIDALLAHLPMAVVDRASADRLLIGQRLNAKSLINYDIIKDMATDEPFGARIYCDGVFIGLAEIHANGRVQPKRMLAPHA